MQKVGFFENIFPCRTRKYGTEGREEGKRKAGSLGRGWGRKIGGSDEGKRRK